MENSSNIIMLRLYSGEYVIGKKNPFQGDTGKTSLLEPRIFAFMPTFTGQVNAGFRPVCMFDDDADEETSVRNEQIWIEIPETKLDKEIVNGYLSEISGIKTASAADLNALGGSASTVPGEFKL